MPSSNQIRLTARNAGRLAYAARGALAAFGHDMREHDRIRYRNRIDAMERGTFYQATDARTKRQAIRRAPGGPPSGLAQLAWKTEHGTYQPLGKVKIRDVIRLRLFNRNGKLVAFVGDHHHAADVDSIAYLECITVDQMRELYAPNDGDVFEGVIVRW